MDFGRSPGCCANFPSYTPSFALCIVAIILFALNTLIHTVQLLRYKVYYFTPLALACLLETFGYIFRCLSSKNDPYNIIWFVVQYFLVVVAPVFISTSIYVCISRLIAWASSIGYAADVRWWLKPKLILWGFVAADVVTTVMQIAGAALVGSSESNGRDPTTGNHILLAGLALQTFSFFVFLAILLLVRLSLARDQGVKMAVRSKDPFMLAILVASLLVYLRTVFRLAETAQGLYGSISTNETFFGTLEFTPIVIAVWILAGWHPGKWLRQNPAAGSILQQEKS